VYLTENDLMTLVYEFKRDYDSFIDAWCRWVPFTGNKERLSLKEKKNLDCVFWEAGCVVYSIRPLQCRTFPFWDDNLCSSLTWKMAGAECPGIDKGELHSQEEIKGLLRQMRKERVIERVVRK